MKMTQNMLTALMMLGMLMMGIGCGDSEGFYAPLGEMDEEMLVEAPLDGKADDVREMTAPTGQMLALDGSGFLLFEGAEVQSTFDGVSVTIRSSQRFGQLVISWEGDTQEIYFRVPNLLSTDDDAWSRLSSVTEVGPGFIGYASMGETAAYEVEFYIEDASRVDTIMIEATR